METKKKRFDDLQVGDLVIVERTMTKSVQKVSKTTKTQIILDNDEKYKKSNGCPVGPTTTWSRTHIVIPTDEMIQNVREDNFKRGLVRNVLNQLSPSSITYEQAIKIKEILDNRK